METYGSRFKLLMAVNNDPKIIPFTVDGSDAGLYLSMFLNDFRTPLAARGTVQELEELLRSLQGE